MPVRQIAKNDKPRPSYDAPAADPHGSEARSSFDGSLSPFSFTAVTAGWFDTVKPHPVRDIPAVGVHDLGQAAGGKVPGVDRHWAGREQRPNQQLRSPNAID
jgi:hypothetical protein